VNQPNTPALTLALLLAASAALAGEVINPYPRALMRADTLTKWTFDKGAEGWGNPFNCTVEAGEGLLKIVSKGEDPYIHSPAFRAAGPVLVRLRLRCRNAGDGAIYWTTDRSGGWGEDKSAHFPIQHDGQWHETEVPLDATGTVTRIRIDPGNAAGTADLDAVEIVRMSYHPLEIAQVEARGRQVTAHVRNHGSEPIACTVNGQQVTVPAGKVATATFQAKADRPFEAVRIAVEAKGLAPFERTVFLYHPEAPGKMATYRADGLVLRVARDGSGVEIERKGKPAAIIAPVVHFGGVVPPLEVTEKDGALILAGKGVRATLSAKGDEIAVAIECEKPCEGPVVRALGPLEQGLLAGLEYLGKGEWSSSKLDLETPEHIRYAPDVMKLTMPLMACVTETASVAVAWDDMTLQPVYATPNFFDGTPDHRMALRGTSIKAAILVRDPQPIEETILWAVKRTDLPPLPKPPRTPEQQWALAMTALNGSLKNDDGWGHCAEARWPRHPYVDHASTIWRLTGKAPDVSKLVPGGAHVPNHSIYFVTGRARQWLEMRRNQVKGIIKSQKPDGSFTYSGKYRRGHFEDTASGQCARPAATLLEFARLTGDPEALKAGLKTLEYMKRFRTPRGLQTWELALHTPDIMASAYLVWAYTRGYELTGEKAWLAEARRWALSGIPFVYLWSNKPVMLYATTPVFGATNWRAPNWIGLPVQWCGGVYAYALGLLAPHEKTLDWAKLARGILISGEQQIYPDGPLAGTLPDSFHLPGQQRRGPNINPCAFASLRMLLDGQVDSLALAADGKHRVVSPFAAELRDGKAHIQAPKGLTYQIVVDGKRVLDIESTGTDAVPLE